MEKEDIWAAGKQILLEAPVLYIEVDVEADGIAGYGSMLSIGAQSITGENFYSEIKPYSEVYLEEHRAMAIKFGIDIEKLEKEAPTIQMVMHNFYNWTMELKNKYKKQPIFSAHNAAFDWAHVDLGFRLAGIHDYPFGIAPLDLKSLSLCLTKNWDFNHTTRDDLPTDILPTEKFTHDPLEDARFQQKIHYGLAYKLIDTNKHN